MFIVEITDEGRNTFNALHGDKGYKITASHFALANIGNYERELEAITYLEVQQHILYQEKVTVGVEDSINYTTFRCDLPPGTPESIVAFREVILLQQVVDENANITYAVIAIGRQRQEDSEIVKNAQDFFKFSFKFNLANFTPDVAASYVFTIREVDRFGAPELRSLLKAGDNCHISNKLGDVVISNISVPPLDRGGEDTSYLGGIRPIWDNGDRLGQQEMDKNAVIRYQTF